MDPTPSVVIVEDNPSGHHLFYVRILVEAALERGWTVRFLTTDLVVRAEEFTVHLEHLRARMTVLTSVHERDIRLSEVEHVAGLSGSGLVVIPDGDAACRELAMGGGWNGPRLRLLVMRERASRGRLPGERTARTLVKQALVRRASRHERVDVVLLKPATWRGESRLRVASDPVVLQANEESRAAVGSKLRAEGALVRWVGVLGTITARKNVQLVTDAVLQCTSPQLGLFICGRIDKDVVQDVARAVAQLHQAGRHAVVVDEAVEECLFDAYVEAMDCVVLAYTNDGPSGLLGKAVASGTPVVTANSPVLRAESTRLTPRVLATDLQPGSLAQEIDRAVGAGRFEPMHLGSDQFCISLLG